MTCIELVMYKTLAKTRNPILNIGNLMPLLTKLLGDPTKDNRSFSKRITA